MKAVILCAGLGTRLGSLTKTVPKVMLPIGGKPLLEHHLRHLSQQGIHEFCVNLHYLPQTITDYFGDGSKFGVRLYYSIEQEIQGTSGGVKRFEPMLRDGAFWVFYGDNLFSIALAPVLEFHRQRQAVVTIVLFEHHEPWTMGVVETDADGRVLRFREKASRETIPPNSRVNAGIYILEPKIFHYIPANRPSDFGKEIFPAMLEGGERIYAVFPGIYLQDIGTPERYEKAQRDFAEGKVKI